MIDKDGAGSDLPLVWVLSTGGTIASSGGSPTDLSNYSVDNLTGDDLINAVPAIGQLARIKVEPIAIVFSSDLTTRHGSAGVAGILWKGPAAERQ
jgi:L-asparaginase/Glu-tRNA(Gln) amidotransferase subunit D